VPKKLHLSCAILYCRMWPLWLPTHPSTLPHERQNFRAFHTTSWTAEFSWKKLLNKKCMVWFFRHLLYETFLILRTERDVITNAYRCLWRYELLSSYFKQLNWLIIFSKHLQISNFIKIHSGSRVVPCGYTDGRTDGRTDEHKANNGFRNSAKVSKKRKHN